MAKTDTQPSESNLRNGFSRYSKLIVHVLLSVYALILGIVVGGLVFNYRPDPSFYFGLSFALFLFALGQCLYEYGARRAFLFLFTASIIGFVVEVVGTSTGFLFGKYSYSDYLGEKILGVPMAVPIAWFVITYVTFSLALSKFSGTKINEYNSLNFSQIKIRRFVIPIILASFGTVAWDFMIDPMFSNYGYWTWQISSSTPQLYGVPLSNFVGWFLVALLVLLAFLFSLKYGSKGPIKLVRRENTWDSRVAYILLMIDAAVANGKLGQYYAVTIGVITMCAFLIATYGFSRKQKESPMKQENTAQISDSK